MAFSSNVSISLSLDSGLFLQLVQRTEMFLGKKFSLPTATTFGWFLYACLLICGFWFSKDAIDTYNEHKTGSEASQVPITMDDLPTVTICYDREGPFEEGYCSSNLQESNILLLDYQVVTSSERPEDWFRIMRYSRPRSNSETTTKTTGANASTSGSLKTATPERSTSNTDYLEVSYYGLVKFRVLCRSYWKEPGEKPRQRICLQLTSTSKLAKGYANWQKAMKDFPPCDWQGTNSFSGGWCNFRIVLELDPDVSFGFKVFFTSEANSYGSLQSQFYEGKVDLMDSGYQESFFHVKIERVQEHWQPSDACTKLSYFETVAKKLEENDLSKYDLTYWVNETQNHQTHWVEKACDFRNLCLSQSLPNSKFPMCPSMPHPCYYKILESIKSEIGEEQYKSCQVKEFGTDYVIRQLHGE